LHHRKIYITAMGIVSPLGQGISLTDNALRNNLVGIGPLDLFPVSHIPPLPVGEIRAFSAVDDMPRTHVLALLAAKEVMEQADGPPDAVVIGVTTGGMTATEELLKRGERDGKRYQYHSTGTVADHIARYVRCNGPLLTVSTACSSGSVALKIALEMLRYGKAKRVLAGGVDALCRLTYYGFHALQLVDKTGAHPFDRNRRGMSVAEGAAMVLLTAAESPPDNAIAELLGGGLSCDAWHPTAPHPEGEGALSAMGKAIADAAITPRDIDYIHLHGTGTIDNDLAEAKAINALFGNHLVPPGSSTKGAFGHSLAAAGAIGAVTAALAISGGFIPGNGGLHDPDPTLNFVPVGTAQKAAVDIVLANAFGFGGNNATLIFGHPKRKRAIGTFIEPEPSRSMISFFVLGSACLTGAGGFKSLVQSMEHNGKGGGLVPAADMTRHLSEKQARRMKRLPRIAMSLAIAACAGKEGDAGEVSPTSVFLGTGWGCLSETHDFLSKLFDSDERFSSPTDFIGSVHNAPAGHIAAHFQAKGSNVTMTGGDCTFEQAMMSASLLTQNENDPILVIGADEYHEAWSPLFDASVALGGTPSDGGGALYLRGRSTPLSCPSSGSSSGPSTCQIGCTFLACADENEEILAELIRQSGGAQRIRDQFGAILAGIPASQRQQGQRQLEDFLTLTQYPHPVIDYRRFTGEFASASAVAAVLAVSFVQSGVIPGCFQKGRQKSLDGRGVLILGFGRHVTAMEVLP
jgi:3-oxoacyl-(acyl-carrier-protein) synthase